MKVKEIIVEVKPSHKFQTVGVTEVITIEDGDDISKIKKEVLSRLADEAWVSIYDLVKRDQEEEAKNPSKPKAKKAYNAAPKSEPSNDQVLIGTIVGSESKSGTTNNRSWTRYVINLQDMENKTHKLTGFNLKGVEVGKRVSCIMKDANTIKTMTEAKTVFNKDGDKVE